MSLKSRIHAFVPRPHHRRTAWPDFLSQVIISTLLTLCGGSALGQVPAGAAAPSAAEQMAPVDDEASRRESMCLLIEAAARGNDLPLDFFARIIWQESRFQTDRVGPPTLNGERAQGIAQFMPETAAALRLLDPFDPIQALPKSAQFLHDLRTEFGNLGLAAAAYNAGPQRVRDWLHGKGSLSGETRAYVLAVTSRPVEAWAQGEAPQGTGLDCRALMALLRGAPNRFVEKLETQVKLVAASPWGVQLSAGFSRERVLASYTRLAKQYARLLAGHEPSIFAIALRSRGTRIFYQVRVGAETREMAESLCTSIEHSGGACMVLRNRTS